jgi:hypothetical protein
LIFVKIVENWKPLKVTITNAKHNMYFAYLIFKCWILEN